MCHLRFLIRSTVVKSRCRVRCGRRPLSRYIACSVGLRTSNGAVCRIFLCTWGALGAFEKRACAAQSPSEPPDDATGPSCAPRSPSPNTTSPTPTPSGPPPSPPSRHHPLPHRLPRRRPHLAAMGQGHPVTMDQLEHAPTTSTQAANPPNSSGPCATCSRLSADKRICPLVAIRTRPLTATDRRA